MKLNIYRRIVFILALSFFMTLVACSSQDRTTTSQSSETVMIDSNTGEQERTVTRTVSSGELEVAEDDGCGGVLSCTVGFVGDVIALPFRAVGALVDFVF